MPHDRDQSNQTAVSPPALEVVNVSHRFGKTLALDDVTLVVKRASFVALLGVNGAGKTTLFSLITRLYDNTSGRIAVLGHDVRRSPGPAHAAMGVVFQGRALEEDLTVTQNLYYQASLHGMSRRLARERATQVLEEARLSDLANARVGHLSGGQIRRAEIARALLHRPDLLLLDEATVGLDVRSRRDVLTLARELAAGSGVGVLWTTHLLDEVAEDDQVVVLHRGRVLANDTALRMARGSDLASVFLELTGLKHEALA